MQRRPISQLLGCLSALLLSASCGAGLSPMEEEQVPTPASELPRITGNLRLVSFSGWTGKAASEHFELLRMELSPYAINGASGSYDLLPDAAFSSLSEGGVFE